MAYARNAVIAGDYCGSTIELVYYNGTSTQVAAIVYEKSRGFWTNSVKCVYLDKQRVANYERITEEHRKSAVSGIGRGLVGGALLGPVGLLAGLSAKEKGKYILAVELINGQQSLLEVDEFYYKKIVMQCF